jgi:hypothetical protein
MQITYLENVYYIGVRLCTLAAHLESFNLIKSSNNFFIIVNFVSVGILKYI